MYTALVLDDISRDRLLSMFSIPNEWEKIAHHMTVCMGSAEQKYPNLLGKGFNLKVISIAQSHQVVAVGVETDCPSDNSRKHIIICVNRGEGGKPVMSNKLIDWQPKNFDITLFGEVKECH